MSNKSQWIWEGKDQGLNKILMDIDRNMVKIEKDSAEMEKAMDRAMKGSARSIDYLREKMRKLQDVRDNTFDEKKIARYNRELRQTEQQISRLQSLGTSRSSRWMGALEATPMGGQLMAFAGNPYVMAGMASMAVGSMASQSVRYGRNFNADMAKINATAQLSPERIANLRDSFFTTANRIGVDVNTLPGAYEGIISATGDKALADRLFNPSLRLAKAGFTDASITGRALSQIMMTPGVNMNENQIADMLMAAKNYGRGELGDFANYLPGLIQTGKLRGFSEQDVTGAYSYLTRSNSAEQASTLMSNFMNVVLRKDVTDEIRKRIKVDVFGKDGQLRDMSSIIGDIGKAMNGLSDKGKQSFLDAIKVVDQQAFQAVGALTAETDKLNDAINTVTNSAGVLNKTLEMSKTGNDALTTFNNNWSQFKYNLASLILPSANKVLQTANDFYDNNFVTAAYQSFFGNEDVMRKRNAESFSNAYGFAENQARSILNQYSKLSPQDQVSAALDDIREKLGERGVSVSSGASVKIREALARLAGDARRSSVPGTETTGLNLSNTPDKAISEHRQVRNVTVNIDNLLQMVNTTVGSQKELTEMTTEPMLNELIKVIRDAETSLNTY